MSHEVTATVLPFHVPSLKCFFVQLRVEGGEHRNADLPQYELTYLLSIRSHQPFCHTFDYIRRPCSDVW